CTASRETSARPKQLMRGALRRAERESFSSGGSLCNGEGDFHLHGVPDTDAQVAWLGNAVVGQTDRKRGLHAQAATRRSHVDGSGDSLLHAVESQRSRKGSLALRCARIQAFQFDLGNDRLVVPGSLV